MPKVILTGSADKFLWIYLGIFAVIVLAIIYFLGRSVGKTAKNNEFAADIKKQNLTFPLSQYGIFADVLYSALFSLNTDEDAVYNVFRKMVTADDVLKLIEAFGSRRQQLTIGSSTLPDWITSQMDSDEVQQINTILMQRNINISF